MRKKIKIDKIKLIPALSLFLILLGGFFGGIQYQKFFGQTEEVTFPQEEKVTRVVDGDTIELSSGQTMRLYAISCPEYGKPFYDEAKEFTEDQVLDKKVSLEYEEKYRSDKFGRILGYVIFDDVNLNIELVRQGFCQAVIYEKRAKLIYQDELLEAQEQAKKEKVGMWGQ